MHVSRTAKQGESVPYAMYWEGGALLFVVLLKCIFSHSNVPFLKYLLFSNFIKNCNLLNFDNKNVQYICIYEAK